MDGIHIIAESIVKIEPETMGGLPEMAAFERAKHPQSLMEVFETLRESSSLVDCTIAAEGQYLKAHRVILSACSPYFKLLFTQENERNPIVVLKDIKFEDVKAVVDLVYRGYIEIPESRRHSFLDAIECLQIKGLENACAEENVESKQEELSPMRGIVCLASEPECALNSFLSTSSKELEVPCASSDANNSSAAETSVEPVSAPSELCGTGDVAPDESPSAGQDVPDALAAATEDMTTVTGTNVVSAPSELSCSREVVAPNKCPSAGREAAEESSVFGAKDVPGPLVTVTETEWDQFSRGLAGLSSEDGELSGGRDGVQPPAAEASRGAAGARRRGAGRRGAGRRGAGRRAGGATEQDSSCEFGTLTFSSSLDLEAHKTHCHVSSHLKRQKRVRMKQKPHRCEVCEASFGQSGDLKKHKRIHTGEKPYRCAECGVYFGDLSVLKRHSRIHTGEKPHRCAECGASFIQSAHLKRHKLVHTEEKPYDCAECGASFKHPAGLRSHKRIHTVEKPYNCVECRASFRQSQGLRKHQWIHAREKPYGCADC